MFDYKLTEDDANALYDVLIRYLGADPKNYWRGEFVATYTTKIPQEHWFMGIGATGWKLWFNPMVGRFDVIHESNRVLPRHLVALSKANTALKHPWALHQA